MIVVVGLSHKTAPIEVREKVALDPAASTELLRALVQQQSIGEAIAISTCNRMELVLAPRTGGQSLTQVEQDAQSVLAQRAPGIEPHLYRHTGTAGLQHLFRVASSLDSLVLGEPQILGQVKAAFEQGRTAGTVGTVLNRVGTQAVRIAKRVRSETAIGTGQVSVPTVAVDLAEQIFGDLKGRVAALIGSGDMGESVAKLLTQAGSKLLVVGRNAARVAELATSLNATARSLDELEQTLIEADVVVAATSAAGHMVSRAVAAQALKKRRGRSLFFVDLAVPRDIDPAIAELDNVFLYNVDDLSQVAAQATAQRQLEAQVAEALVQRELGNFERNANAEQVTPTVVSLRRAFRSVLDAELERSQRGKLRHLTPADLEALQTLFDAALNKLMHAPTQRLRQLATEDPPSAELDTYVEVVSELFSLREENSGVVARGSLPPEPESSAAESALPSSPERGVR